MFNLYIGLMEMIHHKKAEHIKELVNQLIEASKELAFQNEEKEKRANELIVANEELAYQNEEKSKRADEL
jgi:hypothetical protein